MKIRILKNNSKDIGVINLSKIVCVRQKENSKEENSVSLEVFNAGAGLPMHFPDSKFTFEEVQVSAMGKVSYVKRTIPEILRLYEIFG